MADRLLDAASSMTEDLHLHPLEISELDEYECRLLCAGESLCPGDEVLVDGVWYRLPETSFAIGEKINSGNCRFPEGHYRRALQSEEPLDEPVEEQAQDFGWAINRMREGNRVRRRSWHPAYVVGICYGDGAILDALLITDREKNKTGSYSVDHTDVLGTDWEVDNE